MGSVDQVILIYGIFLGSFLETFQQIVILQKAVRITNFQPMNSHTSPLLKCQDQIFVENICHQILK